MTEVGQQWDQADANNLDGHVEDEDARPDAPFVALTRALYEENERLVQLAENCRDHAEQLVEREARLAEREQRVSDAETAIGHQMAELDQREQHVSELMGRAEEVSARLTEAGEREAALAALGVQLSERYRAE
jgi:uncharacterized protein (DUF3084 family)